MFNYMLNTKNTKHTICSFQPRKGNKIQPKRKKKKKRETSQKKVFLENKKIYSWNNFKCIRNHNEHNWTKPDKQKVKVIRFILRSKIQVSSLAISQQSASQLVLQRAEYFRRLICIVTKNKYQCF